MFAHTHTHLCLTYLHIAFIRWKTEYPDEYKMASAAKANKIHLGCDEDNATDDTDDVDFSQEEDSRDTDDYDIQYDDDGSDSDSQEDTGKDNLEDAGDGTNKEERRGHGFLVEAHYHGRPRGDAIASSGSVLSPGDENKALNCRLHDPQKRSLPRIHRDHEGLH